MHIILAHPLNLWLMNTYRSQIKCISSSSILEARNPVMNILWTLNIPWKITCFIWLLEKGKILTWEQLQTHGFHGPSRCVLCEKNIEDIHHLFLVCRFTVNIFSYFAARYGFSYTISNSIPSFLMHWYSITECLAFFRQVPLFIFRCIWTIRNKCLLENWKPSFLSLISRVESFLNLYPVPQKIKIKQIIGPKPLKVFPCAFFDGAAANHLGGAGFVIYLNDNHYLSFSMGCGRSTNTRVESLALWAVLRVCLLMGLPIHLIFGDSMVIISWLNRFSTLDISSLRHWCEDIRNMLHLDPPVIFRHIFREHNSLADDLSKQALNLDMGFGTFSEFLDGLVIAQDHFVLF